MEKKERFIELLKNTKREGIEDLINWLETTDFYKAPASTKYHGACEGGLLEHSLNVYDELKKETDTLMNNVEEIHFNDDSVILVALLHDLCKTNIYKTEYRNTKNEYGTWIKVPYYTIVDDEPYGHGEKSVMLAARFIKLTPEEKYSIRWHMGFTEGKENYNYVSAAYTKYDLAVLTHIADLKATYLLEKEVK